MVHDKSERPKDRGLIKFRDLFFDLQPERLPDLSALERITPDISVFPTKLPLSSQAEIRNQLAPIKELCEHFCFTPVIIELALISDVRLRAADEQ